MSAPLPQDPAPRALALYRARLAALPGVAELSSKTVLIVGLGSVGSDVGARLCRVGARVVGCDPDTLEMENLMRWGLLVAPREVLGRGKAEVFQEALLAAVPGAQVEGHPLDVVRQAVQFEALLVRARPALLIAATDTSDSRRAVNAAALRLGVPALFVGLSDGAASARIELVRPPGPCHLCAVQAEGGEVQARASRTPYGADPAPGPVAVPALPVDIAIGAGLVARLALLLLSGQDPGPYLRNGAQQGNVMFFSLRPDHWVFTEAWQRFVYAVERRADCPACGADDPAEAEGEDGAV